MFNSNIGLQIIIQIWHYCSNSTSARISVHSIDRNASYLFIEYVNITIAALMTKH